MAKICFIYTLRDVVCPEKGLLQHRGRLHLKLKVFWGVFIFLFSVFFLYVDRFKQSFVLCRLICQEPEPLVNS